MDKGPGGRGYCQLYEKSWDGKIIQFAGAPHLCQSFKDKDSITAVAAYDEAIAQVAGEAMQALNPEEDLEEIALWIPELRRCRSWSTWGTSSR